METKIVNVIGGLGNQMFQYAFARALKEKYPVDRVMIDIHHFKHYSLHNGYELERIFENITLPIATAKDIIKLSYYCPNYKISRVIRRLLPARCSEFIQYNRKKGSSYIYDTKAMEVAGSVYYEGYWQSWKYIKQISDILLKEFKFRDIDDINFKQAEMCSETNVVGIHVRRGDYVNHPMLGNVCTLDYYINAITHVKEILGNPHFMFFSNDIAWCKNNLAEIIGDNEVSFIDFNKGAGSYKDMYLMSRCHNLIIANSSFSWWAAFLNREGGMIISPSRWTNLDISHDDLICDDWIKIGT